VDTGTIIVSVLSSTTLNGILTVFLTFRWNSQKARQDLLRQKLEELFIAVQNFECLFTDAILAYNRVPPEQAEAEIAKSEHDRSALRKCQMLVNLYFPDVRTEFNVWMDRHESTIDVLTSSNPDGNGLRVPKRSDRLMEALRDFTAASETLENRLSEIAPTLLGPKLHIIAPATKHKKTTK